MSSKDRLAKTYGERNYAPNHKQILENLKQSTRYHLRGNFSDEQLHGKDSMWYNSSCTILHGKRNMIEEFHSMFKNELKSHVKNIVLPQMNSSEKNSLSSVFIENLKVFEDTVNTFSEVFQDLDQWMIRSKNESIKAISMDIFIRELLLNKEVIECMLSVFRSFIDNHKTNISVKHLTDVRTVYKMLFYLDESDQVLSFIKYYI